MPANSERQALLRAIDIIGGQAELGRELGVTQSGVWYWCRQGRLPAEFVLKVEALSGIPRTRLRPDIYPAAPKKKLPAKKPRRPAKPRPRRAAVEAAA